MSKRIALLIGTYAYQSNPLSQLKRLPIEIDNLAAVLSDPVIGNFDTVETVINQPSSKLNSDIGDLFNWKKRNDMLLLYIAGQAVLDEAGQLYLATVDTALDALQTTAILATHLTTCMDRSFSRQQIVILDCHYSRLARQKPKTGEESIQLMSQLFKDRGYGQVILTANDSTTCTIVGDQVYGQVKEPGFTKYLVETLRTGAADGDADGQIEIRELYEHIAGQVARNASATVQKPRLWTYGKRDKIIVARNPSYVQQKHLIKWDIIFGAIMAPLATIIIGGVSSLSTSIGMAGLFLLLYAGLYLILD